MDLDDEEVHASLQGPAYESLEDLFAAREAKVAREQPEAGAPTGDTGKGSKVINFLDGKRAQNCNIMLRAIRLDAASIRTALHGLDEGVLTKDRLTELLKFLPTPEEVAALRSYAPADVAHFASAEAFLHDVSHIAHYAEKLGALHFKACFAELAQDAALMVTALARASEQVTGSRKLRDLFKLILALGNYLNQGQRGGAYGFKLNSLLKLGDTKSSVAERKHTLLHYLVEVVDDKFPGIQGFDLEIRSVEDACKGRVRGGGVLRLHGCGPSASYTASNSSFTSY
jgi:hypothetical protein